MRVPASRSSKKVASLLGCLIFAGATARPAAGVEEVPFEGFVELGFHNQYNFRGVKAGNWAPSIDVEFLFPLSTGSGLALDVGAWYVDPVTNSYNEFGVYTYLVVPVADFEFSAGGIFFVFPGEDSVTGEFGAAISYSLMDYLDLELDWWSDIKGDSAPGDELRFGHYTEFSASKSLELRNWLGVAIEAGISYGIDYYGVNGWNHAFGFIDFPIGISETITLIPYVGGTLALEGLEDAGENDQFLTGISLSVKF
jgi:hypothetical protein